MNIEVKDLTIKYGDKVVIDNLSHTFGEGKIHIVLGPNGCGKTTLIKNIVSQNENLGEISYVAQETVGNIGLPVEDYVSLGRYKPQKFITGNTSEDKKKIEDAMNLLSLNELKERLFDNLSGGEKQRTMIARAIAQDSSWLILDEPTASLDVKYSSLITKIIKKLNLEGKSVIMICHDINYALNLGQDIVLMKDGKIVDTKRSSEITSEDLEKVFDTKFKKLVTEDDTRFYVSL